MSGQQKLRTGKQEFTGELGGVRWKPSGCRDEIVGLSSLLRMYLQMRKLRLREMKLLAQGHTQIR